MRIEVLGGRHDGSHAVIPEHMGEGQMFLIDKVQYFFHQAKGKEPKLVYYTSSLES
jgi:hypothetical protein